MKVDFYLKAFRAVMERCLQKPPPQGVSIFYGF